MTLQIIAENAVGSISENKNCGNEATLGLRLQSAFRNNYKLNYSYEDM